MRPIDERLLHAYDPEVFRRQGHRLVDLLADYLARTAGGAGPVMPWLSPDEQLAAWTIPSGEPVEPQALWERYLAAANHLHHPRYMGHQVPPPIPAGALSDLVAA